MTRLRLVAALLALLLFGGAVWLVLQAPSSLDGSASSATEESVRRVPVGERVHASAPSGIASRTPTISAEGRVRGVVVDGDGVPLEAGTVSLQCLLPTGVVAPIRDGTVALGDAGRFVGPACRGEVCATLHHPTHVPAEPWLLQPGTEQTLQARSLPQLRGRVYDPEGNPVAGAAVHLVRPSDLVDPAAVPPFTSRSTSTDAEGAFVFHRIERPPCGLCDAQCRDATQDELIFWPAVVVTARTEGLRAAQVTVELPPPADPPEPVELRLVPSLAPIEGQLIGDELPPQAYVLARSEKRPHEVRRAEVEDGAFWVEGLGVGGYTLRLVHDGVELARREGVEAGAQVRMRAEPPASDGE